MRIIVPSFSGNKYENTLTTAGSGVNILFHYVHPDTHMRSHQGPGWYRVIHYVMAQLSMKSGVKIFGTGGVNAVSNYIKQMYLLNTFEPLEPRTLKK